MVVGKRALLLALAVSCFLVQVLSVRTPDPRVGCPVGYNPGAWFLNYKANDKWGSLCSAYATCRDGFSQSPINIPNLPDNGRLPAKLHLTLGKAPVQMIRLNDRVSLPAPASAGTLRWHEQNYHLTRIVFHSPSEHTIHNTYANFEVQLFFEFTDRRGTQNAAVAVLYNCGATCDDAFFSKILPALPLRYKCECGNNRTEPYNPYGAEQCDQGTANKDAPDQCRTNCKLPTCGDGIADKNEECDEKATKNVAGKCKTDCTKPYCGDGVQDPTEECDTGSWWEGSGCTGSCKKECGDACLQPGEDCDWGIPDAKGRHSDANISATTQGIPCRMNCLWARCGDGIKDLGEECDIGDYNNKSSPGGNMNPNACRPGCKLPTCGDGVTDPLFGEQCDGQALCNNTNCQWLCGNGVIQASANETCDDGATNSNAAWVSGAPRPCRTWSNIKFCQPAGCGDDITDFNEQCDDAGIETVRCFANCTLRCGNRIVDSGEECDNGDAKVYPARANDGNSDTRPNACRTNCRACWCGDGVVDPLGCEQCDPGLANLNNTKPNACRSNCKFASCGDGVKDDGEECDDGNTRDDDGCSCCRLDCGNGIKQGAEACDDGAANSNTLPDRCRSSCTKHGCGDGVTDSDEECDDGKTGSARCTAACTLTFCGDGVRQGDEECDNGDNNSYDAIEGCSPVCTLNKCGASISNWEVDLNTIVPSGVVGAYYYRGSSTTPPCNEVYEWFVLPAARQLSPAQCSTFKSIIPGATNRYLQGLYGRNPMVAPTTTYGYVPVDYRAVKVCGDGIVQHGEECDNGRNNDDLAADACRTDCRANRCGDNVRDANEECDGESWCTPVCKRDLRRLRPDEDRWGKCGGNRQSPIRLPQACPAARALNLNHPSNIQYNPTPVVMFNIGEHILFPVLSGGTFNFRGQSYALDVIQFIEPAEHVIGNTRYPFEVQLFHKSTAVGSNAVAALSVLFSEGASANKFLQPLLDRLPRSSECRCGNGIKEDIMSFPDGSYRKEECDDGPMNNDQLPNRCRSDCRMAYCGDGVIDMKEQCDRGVLNRNAPNRCRTNCVVPFCGDGIVDDLMGESCDDGNNVNGDGCNSNCQPECGDGQLGLLEQCDNGIYNSNEKSHGCRTKCQVARCGDGTIDIGEACDDGDLNGLTANTCRANCTLPVCGDGVVDDTFGEECDGGKACSASCKLLCGNGQIDTAAGETCDDGHANSDSVPNACRSSCKKASCGDHVRDDGEACDTGPDTRQCKGCQVVCGNGILDDGEECDDGIYNSDDVPNACRTNCMLWNCGDRVFDNLEECDDGPKNANASDACRPWCRLPYCGDGITDKGRGETCDDGNEADGDGCDSSCQKECGNGRVDPGEVCDDGPRNSDTKPACCRLNCQLPKCGDGVTDAGEECDNGPNGNIAGPNTCRPDCTLPKCGDGIVDHLYGEVCDQGGRNSLTTIDGCSPRCTPNACRQSVHLNTTFNPSSLIPTAAGTYHYGGSSNRVPCQENVDWFVFANPQPISTCQLAQFRRTLSNNARCLQARNGRPVEFLEVTAKCGDGIVEGNEECDNGPANSDFAPNACRRNCRLPRCGDGVQDKGEQCDGTPNCSQTCSLACPGNFANATNGPLAGDTNEINVNFADILA